MSNELDLVVKLRLYCHGVLLDALFAVRIGVQTETLRTSAAFIDNQQQVLASTQRVDFHWTTSVDV